LAQNPKEMKEEISKLRRQIKVYTDEISSFKAENEDLKKGVSLKSKKRMEELQHKLGNMVEANRENESIINRFSEENGVLQDQFLEAQRTHDDVELSKKKFMRRAVRIVLMLDRWLGRLPRNELENFRQSEDYERYARFYDTYIITRKGI